MLEPDLCGPCLVADPQRLTFLNVVTVVAFEALNYRCGVMLILNLFDIKSNKNSVS